MTQVARARRRDRDTDVGCLLVLTVLAYRALPRHMKSLTGQETHK